MTIGFFCKYNMLLSKSQKQKESERVMFVGRYYQSISFDKEFLKHPNGLNYKNALGGISIANNDFFSEGAIYSLVAIDKFKDSNPKEDMYNMLNKIILYNVNDSVTEYLKTRYYEQDIEK